MFGETGRHHCNLGGDLYYIGSRKPHAHFLIWQGGYFVPIRVFELAAVGRYCQDITTYHQADKRWNFRATADETLAQLQNRPDLNSIVAYEVDVFYHAPIPILLGQKRLYSVTSRIYFSAHP